MAKKIKRAPTTNQPKLSLKQKKAAQKAKRAGLSKPPVIPLPTPAATGPGSP